MLVNAESIDGITIVELPQRLDSSTSRAFQQDMAPLMEPNSKLIFDLTHVSHLDSSGIGSMIACLKRLRTSGGEVKLCNSSKQIHTLLELVRLHHVFDIFNTRQEAIDSYK
jgi:anti-sigma B factor antagonist